MSTGYAPGKIILSGEYAVVFGYPGIAIPAPIGITAEFFEDVSCDGVEIRIEGDDTAVRAYAEKIVTLCQVRKRQGGRLSIKWDLPLWKGMGSSTAFVVAISRALLGEDRVAALAIEDALNPGHSGLDFTTIWESSPVLFKKGTESTYLELSSDLLKNAVLIDTGFPSDSTPQLVAWMKSREHEVEDSLRVIGECADRIVKGEDLKKVIRDHHRAQLALGVVPQDVTDMIAEIESVGGAAKVIGAGSRMGGAGMVLALGDGGTIIHKVAEKRRMRTNRLHKQSCFYRFSCRQLF